MNGKRKMWSVCIILAVTLVVGGLFYYYYQTNQAQLESEGTLIMQSEIKPL